MTDRAGIRKFRHGWRVFVRVRTGHGRSVLKTRVFSKAATLTQMKQWREDQRVLARRSAPAKATPGTFAADVAHYLSLVSAMPTFAFRQRDLMTWCEQSRSGPY